MATRPRPGDPAPPGDAPRSLADDLRLRSDDELAALLRQRPDLLHPVPADLTALAVRASGHSAVRALDRLDALAIQVAEVVAALDAGAVGTVAVSADDVISGIVDSWRSAAAGPNEEAPAVVAAVHDALDRLRTVGLLWGTPDDLHLVRAAADALGPYPCGLAAADATPMARRDGASLMDALDDVPAAAAAALETLVWGPPVGRVAHADRPVSQASARTPVEWLLARGLLVPTGRQTVVLPRDVALHLRGGRLLRELAYPPVLPVADAVHDIDRVDGTGGQRAYDAVGAVTDLLDAWSASPPPVLRSGSLSVRDLAAAARLLDTDEVTAALVAEVAVAAGLVARDREADEAWAPTTGFDEWLERDTATRWAVLARAWLTMSRLPGMVGLRDGRGTRLNALGPEIERPEAEAIRRGTLDVLAMTAPGSSAPAAQIVAVLDDRRPRLRSAMREEAVSWVLREAEFLGVTGLGALTSAGRALPEDHVTGGPTTAARRSAAPRGDRTWPMPPPALVAAIEEHLPAPVDHVLLQADLTAIAPGPLVPELAREMRLAADIESTGGATVFRFSESSIRRALDAGRDGAALLALLAERSRTPVPQPLAYLVSDVARRHGSVRIGAAAAYIRSDDEAALSAALADRRLAGLGLSRLAPTVLIALAAPDEVALALREAGLAPAIEAPNGTVVVRRPPAHRAPVTAERPPPLTPGQDVPDDTLLAAAVTALRAGDKARSRSGSHPAAAAPTRESATWEPLPRTSAARTLDLLRAAIDEDRPIVIGYADPAGSTSRRLVTPVRLGGGFLTAVDHRTSSVQAFPVARITGVTGTDGD